MDEVTENIPKTRTLWMKPCHINPRLAPPLQWVLPFQLALLKIWVKEKKRKEDKTKADQLQNFWESRVGGAVWKNSH